MILAIVLANFFVYLSGNSVLLMIFLDIGHYLQGLDVHGDNCSTYHKGWHIISRRLFAGPWLCESGVDWLGLSALQLGTCQSGLQKIAPGNHAGVAMKI